MAVSSARVHRRAAEPFRHSARVESNKTAHLHKWDPPLSDESAHVPFGDPEVRGELPLIQQDRQHGTDNRRLVTSLHHHAALELLQRHNVVAVGRPSPVSITASLDCASPTASQSNMEPPLCGGRGDRRYIGEARASTLLSRGRW